MVDQRLRLLFIRDYFFENTDETHTVTVPELIAAIMAAGFTADRRTVYTDIKSLCAYGMDIRKRRSKTHDYYLASRTFELAELKLMVDAVQSARFLTAKKSDRLIQKLSNLTSRHHARQLSRYVHVQNRVKTDNERIYQTVDAIHAAVRDGRKIGFRYCQYTQSGTLRPRRGGETYVVSPYLLSWAEDNYYLIADHPVHTGPTHYRVDKMTDVTVLEEALTPPERALEPADYAKKLFSMYAGDETWVELAFDEALIGAAIDRFGTDVTIRQTDDGACIVRAKVAVSPSFFGWLFQFGDQVTIVSPADVRMRMAQLLAQTQRRY